MSSAITEKYFFHPPLKTGAVLLLCIGLTACSSQPSRYALKHDRGPDKYINHDSVSDAVPRDEPRSKGGNKNYRVLGKNYRVLQSSAGYKKRGIASWYGKKFHGHRTSNGEIYDMYQMSAAHKSLPLPTYIRVTHLKNGRSVIVRVNDRGPFHRNRIIDLSYVAAKKLGITATGTGVVEITAINPKTYRSQQYSAQTTQYNRNRSNSSKAGRFADHPATANPDFKIFLQAGAFSERQNAQSLRNRIANMRLPFGIKVQYNARQGLFKVRLGPFDTVEMADNTSETLFKNQIDNAYIIVD